jgi:hypothetical protein
MTDTASSPLRRRMIEDMAVRKFNCGESLLCLPLWKNARILAMGPI